VELTTDRLVLREYALDDLEDVQAYAGDPEVSRFMEWGPNELDDTRAFLEVVTSSAREQPRSAYELAVTLDGRVVGGVGLRVKSEQHRRGDMGWVLRRDAWGNGYATEAARALLRFGVEQLDLHRVEATCAPDNVASARVMERLGMQYEGRMRHHLLVRDAWRDSLLHAFVVG
jgi:RimJ/RimL family protein N-acetyltransferase